MEKIGNNTEKTSGEIVRELILEAAASGGTLHRRVMIGDTPLPADTSLEDARTILFEMIETGAVELNPDYTLRLPAVTEE